MLRQKILNNTSMESRRMNALKTTQEGLMPNKPDQHRHLRNMYPFLTYKGDLTNMLKANGTLNIPICNQESKCANNLH